LKLRNPSLCVEISARNAASLDELKNIGPKTFTTVQEFFVRFFDTIRARNATVNDDRSRRTRTVTSARFSSTEIPVAQVFRHQARNEEKFRMKSLQRFFPRAAVSLLLLLATCAFASARQTKVRLPQASPQATVSQTVGITDVTITYHRPSVRGRKVWGDIPQTKVDELIKASAVAPTAATEGTVDGAPGSGKEFPLAPNGHVWRAGANEATKFVVTDDVFINDQKLPAGAYSLHAIPGNGEWTLVFNKTADQWGSFRYDAKQDALRIKVKPEAAPMQEWLSYEITLAGPDAARVELRWEKLAVPFMVKIPNQDALVRSKIDAAIAADPNNWQIPLDVGSAYFNDDKLEDALKWVEQSIKVKETFQNLRTKANLLFNMGKKPEAIAVGEQAVARGKADGVDTSRFEKFLADLKAGKM
jgi:hypothetical protein